MPEYHAAFREAAVEHRWTMKLALLRPELEKQARANGKSWSWCVLPHGACVALRRGEGLCQVRISRKEVPPGGSLQKWEQELAIFQRELLIEGWDRADLVDVIGIAATFSCSESLLCQWCGRKKSQNASLFGDGCDHCGLANKTGKAQ